MQGNNANQRMGQMPGMMPMGMGMPMMGMPMMGVPMMNPMMGIPMMNPMMGMGSNAPNMGNAGPAGPVGPMGPVGPVGSVAGPAMGASLAQPSAKSPPILGTTGGLMPKIDPPGLAHGSLEPGRVPMVPAVPVVSSGLQRERSRSRDAERSQAEVPVVEEKEEPAEKEPPRCHLHNTKKPNAKCKFCQRASKGCKAAPKKGKEEAGEGKDHKEEHGGQGKLKKDMDDEEDYSRRTFNCSPILKDQILGSSYFKSMLQLTTIDEIIEEIKNYADTLDVYNSGSSTSPSNFVCQVYRIFTLPEAEDLNQLQVILENSTPTVRCAGLIYLRFVVPPAKLFDKLEEYLFDEMELKYQEAGRSVTTTIGEYVEGLLGKEKYFGRPLPRVPVKVKHQLEKELAPISQYRKRMEAHMKNNIKKIAGTPVEVFHDGQWVPGTAQDFVGRVVKGRKVKVELENAQEVNVHMGKVVLRDEGGKAEDRGDDKESGDDKSGSEDEGKKKRKRRSSRSRSRRKSRSPSLDWCRYKGSQDKDLLEALRERAREEAVCSYGKTYSRSSRPVTTTEGGDKSSRSDNKDSGGGEFRSKMRQEEEEEHKRRMRDIYEKYGNQKAATSNYAAGPRTEIDQPDVLRLG
mmetsp:Transcript_36318/g.78314  ORF Transcript_36318/g.78314 Transcript_36318/m.78314 type:complete len:628 (+) Transcript_36318:53-1936(+)